MKSIMRWVAVGCFSVAMVSFAGCQKDRCTGTCGQTACATKCATPCSKANTKCAKDCPKKCPKDCKKACCAKKPTK